MPNRILKESITTSCEINQLSAYEERFFYRLIVICDDFGRAEARTPILRAKCFPLKLDKVKEKDVEKWLSGLIAAGLVQLYSVNDKLYLQMVTWDKHQHRRAKTSKFPGPEQGTKAPASRCDHVRADSPEESRNRGIEEREYSEFFERVWKEYPEKKGKASVSNTQKRVLYQHGFDTIKKCIDRYKATKEDWKKWQHGSTFFNSGYVDYLDENFQEQEQPKPQAWMTRREQVERGLLS